VADRFDVSKKTQRPPRADVAPGAVCLVVVGVGGHEYAIPSLMVRAISPYRQPHPVPGSASHIEGVVNLRGRLVPVMILRTRLGIHGGWSHAHARTVVVGSESGMAGLVVDEVREVVGIDPRRFAAIGRGAEGSDGLVGTFRVDGHRIGLLDVPGLLAEGPLAA
jgi:purine-binding chemotaxis protein CheW